MGSHALYNWYQQVKKKGMFIFLLNFVTCYNENANPFVHVAELFWWSKEASH